MNSNLHLAAGVALLLSTAGIFADESAVNTPPGAVVPPSSTNAQPETPAPAQANAVSAPGAASPNGANGVTIKGKAVTKAPNSPSKKGKKPAAASVAASSPAPSVPTTSKSAPPPPAKPQTAPILEDYLDSLSGPLKLSADEKKDIQTYYLEDGDRLMQILNDNSISALQQAQQVSDLRDNRNDKIEALLGDVERRHEFFRLEAKYRVALTEASAKGALCPATAPAPVPAPTDTPPGTAEPTPTQNHPVE